MPDHMDRAVHEFVIEYSRARTKMTRIYFSARRLLVILVVASTGLSTVFANAQTRNSHTTTKAYPTGNVATSVILLERTMPKEVRIGQDFEYTIRLSNLTNGRVDDVVFTEQFPGNFRVQNVSPKPTSTQGSLATWQVGTLSPRGSKRFRIKGTASQLGDLSSCGTVIFNTKSCSSVRIVEPKLELVKTAPREVMLCAPIPLKFVVTNRGSGVAQNVMVTDRLPEGWTTLDGKSSIKMNAGDLTAGTSREFTAKVRSSKTGNFENRAVATEAGGLTAESVTNTRVVRPRLTLTKSCPDLRYIGRPANFEITVSNTGDATAQNAVLVDTLPPGLQFLNANDAGRFTRGQVTWHLGNIGPGDSRVVNLKCMASQPGQFRNTAQVKAYCAEATGECTLKVRGVPALLLEVIDIDDPIEIGENETYEITILNQGTAPGTNLVITCDLPPEQTFVSADGPTRGSGSPKRVVFAPLPSLAPKATAKYRVIVKGEGVGDVRFKVKLTGDQLDSPVDETESTHIY